VETKFGFELELRHSDGGGAIEAANGLCLKIRILSLLDHYVDGRRQTNPVRQFPFQLLPSKTCKGVELCHSPGLSRAPLDLDLDLLFQLVQSWILRAVLNLPRIIAVLWMYLANLCPWAQSNRSIRKLNMSNVS
jgi:hypothetical protein